MASILYLGGAFLLLAAGLFVELFFCTVLLGMDLDAFDVFLVLDRIVTS